MIKFFACVCFVLIGIELMCTWMLLYDAVSNDYLREGRCDWMIPIGLPGTLFWIIGACVLMTDEEVPKSRNASQEAH